MRIAYILHSTAITEGATKAFLNMLDGLMGKGIKPFVVLPDKEGVYEEFQRRQIPTLVVTFRQSAYPPLNTMKQYLLFVPKFAARIFVNHKAPPVVSAWFKENHIDLVHTNTGVVRIGFDAAQKGGLPHIYHIREYADKIGIKYFPSQSAFISQLGLNDSYSICITQAVQKHYHQDGNRNSHVIYDGVFPEAAKMPEAQTKNYFLFVGRIQPAKGLDQLLQAYNIYASKAKSPLHLKIAGSNADNAYYNRQTEYISNNRLTALVEFLGNRHDTADIMRNARALIVASPFEGFGFCMPEAQQQGCLVIARNTSGTKEQLDKAKEMTDQEIALRYESTEQLAALLTEVDQKAPAFYDSYTRKAFDVVNKLYTKEQNAKEVYQLYCSILKKH